MMGPNLGGFALPCPACLKFSWLVPASPPQWLVTAKVREAPSVCVKGGWTPWRLEWTLALARLACED